MRKVKYWWHIMSIPPILATSLGQICMEKTIDEHGWSCSKEACIASCHRFESIFKKRSSKGKATWKLGLKKNPTHKRRGGTKPITNIEDRACVDFGLLHFCEHMVLSNVGFHKVMDALILVVVLLGLLELTKWLVTFKEYCCVFFSIIS